MKCKKCENEVWVKNMEYTIVDRFGEEWTFDGKLAEMFMRIKGMQE